MIVSPFAIHRRHHSVRCTTTSAVMAGLPWWPSIFLFALVLLGSWDLLQRKHSLYRNYPLTGHFRNIAEEMRTQIRQYFIESDTDGTPFDREQRSLVYQRAKNVVDTMPFGTERRVTDVGYEWINHSIAPRPKGVEPFRTLIGNAQCARPYSISVLNISAMSFGALSANAILALNLGARRGAFAHDAGEGGFSRYHRRTWRRHHFTGRQRLLRLSHTRRPLFPERFAELAGEPQVKMIEIKLRRARNPVMAACCLRPRYRRKSPVHSRR